METGHQPIRVTRLFSQLGYAGVSSLTVTAEEGSMSDVIYHGRCFCGAVELEASGRPAGMGYCHCASCREWSASQVNAFTLWPPASIKVTKGSEHLASYAKTPGSVRKFCDKCGGHVMTEHPGLNLIDVFS